MYSATFIFLTILGISLAYLPDPDNCCEKVKIKKTSKSWLNGKVLKLDTAREYLEYNICPSCDYDVIGHEVIDARIAYEDGEWQVQWGFLMQYILVSSNSSQACPENVEVWTNRGVLGEYLSVSEVEINCYKPFHKKYWYVILITSLLPLVCCYLCCFGCCCCSMKNTKSDNSFVNM